MNILDLHVNCQVALHPKQFDQLESNQPFASRSSTVIKETPSVQSTSTKTMEYEDSAFKYQPFKRQSNDPETSYQNSSLYNMYDKWHYYSMSPSERYGASDYHNGIIPLGYSSISEQNGSNSYMDASYRRYASDLYGQMYDPQLTESGFYPYSTNLNPYLNLCENSHGTNYYPPKSRYQIPQTSYRNVQETESFNDNKPDNHWYVLPSSRSCATAAEADQGNTYTTQDQSSSYPAATSYATKHSSYTEKTRNGHSQPEISYKHSKQSGSGKSSNFTLHVRKQERKLKKRLKDLQSKNCDKASQLQEYYHYKIIMIEKQAQQRQQLNPMYGGAEACEETDVQILQLVHEIEERINAIQCSMSSDVSDKYGQVCTAERKTRLLPKHAIKTLENWYDDNLSNPYPSRDQTVRLALDCGLTIEQVRKWFANKRNRSRNNKLHLLK